MPAIRSSLITAFFSMSLLYGCGGSDAVSEAGSRPNSFPEGSNSLDDFDTGSTGDSSNSNGLEFNEIRVTVEVPGDLAPDGELTRRKLRIVDPDLIQVYETDQTLREGASVDVDIRSDDSGRRIVTFNDGLPVGPNVLIKAYVGNTIIRSLATDSDRDVKINPFSEYLVSQGLGSYTSTQFDQVMACANSTSDTLCLNKYVWATLNDQIHDFEIDIAEQLSVPQAVASLAGRIDFSSYVADMAAYALFDTATSGKISASSVDYNSVLFGIELGQSFREPSLKSPGQWGVRIATEERVEDVNGVAYIYPGLTLTNFEVFNIRVTSLASDVPYNRETLMQTSANEFFDRGAETWDLNAHTTAPGAATLQDELRLVAGRALYQSITGRDSSEVIGWTRNPYFQDAYIGGGIDEPDEVLTGYFSGGKAIKLLEAGDELKREQTLEEHYLSVLEFNLARTPGYSVDLLEGKSYNVLTFSFALNDASVSPMLAESDVGSWAISDIGNPDALNVAETVSTATITRNGSDATVANASSARVVTRSVSLRESRLNSGDQQIGRLNLSAGLGNTGDIVGAGSPAGDLLAFNMDDVVVQGDDLGDGLIIAAQQAASRPSSGTYRLQGVIIGMDTATNRLQHLQDATLTIDSDSQATVQVAGVEVLHTVNPQSITTPMALEDDLVFTYGDLGNGNITLTSGGVTLTGFTTADHDKLFLRWEDNSTSEKTLGLIMATKLP